jgi:hypothetical protein
MQKTGERLRGGTLERARERHDDRKTQERRKGKSKSEGGEKKHRTEEEKATKIISERQTLAGRQFRAPQDNKGDMSGCKKPARESRERHDRKTQERRKVIDLLGDQLN